MKSLEALLLAEYSVSESDIEKAKNYQLKHQGRLEKILINIGAFPEELLANLYSDYFNLPRFVPENLQEFEAPEMAQEDLDLLLRHKWAPLQIEEGTWTCIACYPLELEVNQLVNRKMVNVQLSICTEAEFNDYVSAYLEKNTSTEQSFELSDSEEARLKELASEAPTVNLLNSLISRALRANSSDMHLEPIGGKYRVRYRVDGVLQTIENIPEKMRLPIATRLKILSGMDIAEKRRPQDGKIEMRIANQEIDIRVSALPLNEGESIVMRFLRKDSVRYDMSVLGLSEDIQQKIDEDLRSTAGVILLTGPTGSGKTTSLYTFLNALNDDDVKIITLEDPVEYQLEGINQVHVNAEIGFDFASGLRSIVRQDPDIIMLGEIRDSETARVAMQSALTGHLVFSTVHTNDAPSAYTRLIDLGVEEFLLNAALVSIVAQRLARKICPECKVVDETAHDRIVKYGVQEDLKVVTTESSPVFYKGEGCEHCNYTGYKGRTAMVEYLRCDNHIKSIPKDENFVMEAKKHNLQIGARTLIQDGLYKALNGVTSLDEVIRVAG